MTTELLPGGSMLDPVATTRGNERASASAIYRSLLVSLQDGSVRPGGRLPNERELASRFGTGRSSVRTALSMMEQQGLVRRRVGSGTFLAEDAGEIFARLDAVSIPSHAEVPDFAEILEGRLLLEPAMVALAAVRASDADIAAMEAQLEAVLAAPTWIDFKEAIYGLHGCLYRASGNRFLMQVFDNIVTDRRAVLFDGRETSREVPQPVKQQAYGDLKAIIEAVRRRDARASEGVMRDYLLRTLATVNIYAAA
jgi:GntR family transcriptional regulator, transcriptional repressor for pyruvate dehydrogenase complex